MDSPVLPELVVELDGGTLASEADFHDRLAAQLGLPPWYGRDLNALWETLGGPDVPRPLRIVWKNSWASRERLGDDYLRIVKILQRVAAEDRRANRKHPLALELR